MAEFLDMNNQAIRLQVMGVMQEWRLQAEVQIGQMHERLDALLAQQQQRFLELDTRSAGMNPTVDDRLDAFYGALDARRDDRVEYQEGNVLSVLERRLDGLSQAMDAQLPPGVENLPETSRGHVDDTLYWQVQQLQGRVDALKYGEQRQHQGHEQGMGY
jgi:hypothetical protein